MPKYLQQHIAVSLSHSTLENTLSRQRSAKAQKRMAQVENTIDLQLDKDGAYNISILSAGQQIEATINGGGESEIFINQSN